VSDISNVHRLRNQGRKALKVASAFRGVGVDSGLLAQAADFNWQTAEGVAGVSRCSEETRALVFGILDGMADLENADGC
jgi:hypothetical protein